MVYEIMNPKWLLEQLSGTFSAINPIFLSGLLLNANLTESNYVIKSRMMHIHFLEAQKVIKSLRNMNDD